MKIIYKDWRNSYEKVEVSIDIAIGIMLAAVSNDPYRMISNCQEMLCKFSVVMFQMKDKSEAEKVKYLLNDRFEVVDSED